MNDDSDIISGFDSSADHESLFAVDYSAAHQLNRSGSTCYAYECTVQHRRVFIKRLKTEYRDNPLYRAAFSKEYDLGVSLSHPSLPRYVGFGGDYIAMDFIEGDTLSELIKRGDRRLENKSFLRKLMNELIDVVEYLHARNIVHCDIKADNIIISPYRDRPAKLIDLDKAYTSWLSDTSGNPAKYDCDGCADGAIDFRGIGLIAAKLGLKKIAKACDRSDITADSLRALLNHRKKFILWVVAGIVAVAGAVAAIVFLPKNSPVGDAEASISNPEAATLDTTAIVADTVMLKPQPTVSHKPAIDAAWISALIAEKSVPIKKYRKELMAILNSDSVPIGDKRTAVMEYTESYGRAITDIIYSAVSHYRFLPEIDVQNAVRSHPDWTRLSNEEAEMQTLVTDWIVKESRRSSDRPVSQPDTILNEPLRAPHH